MCQCTIIKRKNVLDKKTRIWQMQNVVRYENPQRIEGIKEMGIRKTERKRFNSEGHGGMCSHRL